MGVAHQLQRPVAEELEGPLTNPHLVVFESLFR